MLKLPPSDWSLSSPLTWLLAIVCGLSFAAPATLPQLRADDAAVEEEEEEDPLADLTGLLDPTSAKPLMTLAEEKDFRLRHESNYTRTALKSLAPSNKTSEEIEAGVRYRVLRLTIPENWPYIAQRTKDLVNDLDIFAEPAPRAREVALKAAIKELEALVFSDQPSFVKINAAGLLGRLNIESVNYRAKTPAIPYAPTAEPLVKVLNDSNLRLDVKIPAVRGVERVLEDGDPSRELRDRISKALTDQLNAIDTYDEGEVRHWYHWRLVDALGSVEFPRTMTQQTYVVDALWQTMHDDGLPWPIRCRAARSLGQLKLDASFNIPLLVHEIVLLAGRMTFTYNQNPKFSFWKSCFSDLYFAFRAQEPSQQARGWGLLQNPPAAARGIIEGAYQVVLPLVNGVLKNQVPQPVDNELLKAASKWLSANEPADKKIHQQAKPLTKQAEPQPEPPANGNTQAPPTVTQPAARPESVPTSIEPGE